MRLVLARELLHDLNLRLFTRQRSGSQSSTLGGVLGLFVGVGALAVPLYTQLLLEYILRPKPGSAKAFDARLHRQPVCIVPGKDSVMTRIFALFLAVFSLIGAGPALAGAMLTVVNSSLGPDAAKEFSRTELKEMAQTSYHTTTEWTDGAPEFSGPLARDVIAAVGVGDATVAVMTAANDYAIEVPIEELIKYDVILATSVDGRRLSLRDKGPIWVMYPRDQHSELQDPVYNGRLIWQMVRIELK